MTAVSPKTMDTPLNEKRAMKVLKQVNDLGELFKIASDLEDIKQSFLNTAQQENGFRGTSCSINQVLNDVMDIAFKYSQALLKGANNSLPGIALINEGLNRISNYLRLKIGQQDIKSAFTRIVYLASVLKNKYTTRLIKTVDLFSIKDVIIT